MKLPIISRLHTNVARQQLAHVLSVARAILDEHPQLDWNRNNYRNLVVREPIEDLPSLQLDDFTEIPLIGATDNAQVLQQRARLRAVDGDWLALSRKVEPGFLDYYEYKLGLGRVTCLYPAIEPSSARQLAIECWLDRRIRRDLVQAVRQQGLRYIHPHVSTMHVWELAAMLSTATRRPVNVIGPTPELARWANDKIEFTRAVACLLGRRLVPHTECAYNFATLSKQVLRLAATNRRLGIKFPYGTGGAGNFLIKCEHVRGRSLRQVRAQLKRLLAAHIWPASGRVLINVWETNVISSPSVQTWIPPLGHGEPILEGLFEQIVTGDQGTFTGSFPAQLPADLEQQIVDYSFLLASLFQQLGYVGRCSFDLILVGEDLGSCNIEFIECNARWGGTSAPMTLMNRLHFDLSKRTYGIRRIKIPGLNRIDFSQLLRGLGDDLFDHSTGHGKFVLMNPARIKASSAIEVIAMGTSTSQVHELLNNVFPSRVTKILNQTSTNNISAADVDSSRSQSTRLFEMRSI